MTLPDLCSTFEPAFFLKDQKLKDIVEQFKKEMKEGLEDYGKDMAMVPSFVTGVPDGSEQGCVTYERIRRGANGLERSWLWIWEEPICMLCPNI